MRMAAEFSFFLAVPTMLAVTSYSIFLKDWDVPVVIDTVEKIVEMKGYEMLMEKNYLILFILGNIIAFVVAVLAIKFFIGILKKYGFKMWGWYRIVLGIAFIIFEVFFNK